VSEIDRAGDDVVVRTPARDLCVGQVVLTAGPWLSALVPGLPQEAVRMPTTWTGVSSVRGGEGFHRQRTRRRRADVLRGGGPSLRARFAHILATARSNWPSFSGSAPAATEAWSPHRACGGGARSVQVLRARPAEHQAALGIAAGVEAGAPQHRAVGVGERQPPGVDADGNAVPEQGVVVAVGGVQLAAYLMIGVVDGQVAADPD
jgi:hypothetical protein